MAKEFKVEVEIPEGVNATQEKGVFTVKGEKGEVVRDLFHPAIESKVEGNKVIFNVPRFTQSEKKILFTFRAHLRNMFKGVSEGVNYKLKICSSHFPMTVVYKDQTLEVKNFIGEKHPRTLEISKEVQVKVEGNVIELDGVDKEAVGQAAGSIEKLTRRCGFDRRIFQDGIYIINKDGKTIK